MKVTSNVIEVICLCHFKLVMITRQYIFEIKKLMAPMRENVTFCDCAQLLLM